MNDDQQFELASAYLDGAVTDEERARVEGDSELLALVRELRSISTAVSDAPPASAAVRETAIAAALAAFDQLSAGERAGEPTDVMPATPVETPPAPSLAGVDQSSVAPGDALVVPLAPRRRFRLGHAVSVAAAAVVVMAGGVTLLRDNAEAPTNEAVNEARQTVAPVPTDVTGPGGPRTSVAAAPITAATTVPAPGGAPAPTQRDDDTEQAEDDAVADNAGDDDASAGDATEREEAAEQDSAGNAELAATADDGEQGSAATPPQAPAAAPSPTEAIVSPTDTDTDTLAADAGPSTALPAATAALPPSSAAASEMATAAAPVEPPELTTREEFAEFANALAEPPLTMSEVAPGSSVTNYSPAITPELLPLDQALARCVTPGPDPLASDAVYVTEDGVSHPIALVLVGDEDPPEYGGVDVVTCTLVVDTAEPSLVTTTTAGTTTTPTS